MIGSRPRHRRRIVQRVIGIGALVAGVAVALGLAAPSLHLLGSRPTSLVASARPHADVVAVFVSGDMGLHFGLGAAVVPALAAHGIPVLGVTSPVNFATHRTRAQTDRIIADAIRQAMARTGARRVILMGQSFGADMVATVAPDLPADLRRHIAAITVVVPAQTVFFRSDPTGLTYYGTPDAYPAAALQRLDWAPIVCIYGAEERESLCPALPGKTVRTVALPGGHYLRNDSDLLIATLLRELRAIDPTLLP